MNFSRISCLFILGLFSFFQASAQKKFTLSGYVKDSVSGESLIGATIYNSEKLTEGAVTNEYGFYSLSLAPGKYNIKVSYLGYKTRMREVNLTGNMKINFSLPSAAIVGEEVVVKGERENTNVTSNEMSRVELSVEKIKSLPVLFGEPDVFKAITLLPGIKSGGEGSTGFYVRGGGPDQNLIIIDEATVYNPSHLLGFFSVFNADAIKNVEVIKGGMPANYGGRLSSIVNVNMKEGNSREFHGEGGIGLISSKLMLEGPIKKDKSSFLVTARRTYIDVLVQPFLKDNLKGNGYFFYDLNAKANYIISDKDRIFFSGYLGRDLFNYKGKDVRSINLGVDWGNQTATLRWNHIFNPRLFSNTSVIYNGYNFKTEAGFGNNKLELFSGIRDINLKSDFQYFQNQKNKIKFGGIYTFHTFTPGIASVQQQTQIIETEINKQYAHETALYVSDDYDFNDRISFSAGLRYSYFNQVGPFKKQIFDNLGTPTDSFLTFKANESIADYGGWEPRFAIRYNLNSLSSIKASFTKTYQYLHLATTSGATLPTDLWIPASDKVKPQRAFQYAAGYFRNFNNNTYESSVEVYYKPMLNQIEFRPGAQLFFNQNLENEIINGSGLSYGAEFFFKKTKGITTGWFGYTWSKTTRTFAELNGGESFFYRYDRRHDLSFVLTHKINDKWEGNFVFIYGTGIAFTMPTSRYAYFVGFDDKNDPTFNIIDNYDKINNIRLPAYHRADISMTYRPVPKSKKFESYWNFSVYNIYNRKNPYFIYNDPDPQTMRITTRMVYLFPILPSVSWNFKF